MKLHKNHPTNDVHVHSIKVSVIQMSVCDSSCNPPKSILNLKTNIIFMEFLKNYTKCVGTNNLFKIEACIQLIKIIANFSILRLKNYYYMSRHAVSTRLHSITDFMMFDFNLLWKKPDCN